MQTRRASIKVKFREYDVTTALAAFLLSFSYDEAADKEADSCEFKLQDRDQLWINSWFPRRGEKVNVSIVTSDNGIDQELPLGVMTIDEITNEMPPSTCTIKATSIPTTAPIKAAEWSHSWENVKLRQIGNDIAYYVRMRYYFDADDDPLLRRAEMHDQSPLSFLQKLCTDHGLLLKVSDDAIIIADYKKYEDAAPIATLVKGESAILSFSARTTLNDTYKAAEVSYSHGKKKETIGATFTDPNKADSDGLTLKINQRVEDQADAERLARQKLREKNMKENTISLKVVGDLRLRATSTVTLRGFGVFDDGKYLIQKVKHDLGTSGFVTSIELTKCLGY